MIIIIELRIEVFIYIVTLYFVQLWMRLKIFHIEYTHHYKCLKLFFVYAIIQNVQPELICTSQ